MVCDGGDGASTGDGASAATRLGMLPLLGGRYLLRGGWGRDGFWERRRRDGLGKGSRGRSDIDEAHLRGFFRRGPDVVDLFGKDQDSPMDSEGNGERGEEGRMFHSVSGDDGERSKVIYPKGPSGVKL